MILGRNERWCRDNCPLGAGTVPSFGFVPDLVNGPKDEPGLVLVFSHVTQSEAISGRRWWTMLVPPEVKIRGVIHSVRCYSKHWRDNFILSRNACARRYEDGDLPRPDYFYCTLDSEKVFRSEVFRDLIILDIQRAYRIAKKRNAVVYVLFGPEVINFYIPHASDYGEKQLRGSWWIGEPRSEAN